MKRFLRAYVRFVQKAVVTVLLGGLYLFGFGSTKLLALIVRRKLLRPAGTEESCWHPAEGYDLDLESAQEQS